MDVNALLKALQTTLRFEQEMASRFGAPTPAPAPPVRRDSGRESEMRSLIQAVCRESLRLKYVTSLPLSMIIFSLFLLLMLFFNISHPIFHSHPLLPHSQTLSLLLTPYTLFFLTLYSRLKQSDD